MGEYKTRVVIESTARKEAIHARGKKMDFVHGESKIYMNVGEPDAEPTLSPFSCRSS